MKYTIIALLFIGMAYGQTTTEFYYPKGNLLPIWVIDSVGQYPTPKPKSMYRHIADAYDEYVASLREEFEAEWSQLIKDMKYYRNIQIEFFGKDTVYITYNKQPYSADRFLVRKRPTLEGFMDYLRSK